MIIFKKYKIALAVIIFLGLIVSKSVYAAVDVFVDDGGTDLNPTSFSFEGDVVGAGAGFSMIPVWGVTATSLTNSAPVITPLADGSFSGSITGLTPNTTYYYQFIDAADGTIKLTIVDSFTTPLVFAGTDGGKDAVDLTGSGSGTSNPNCTNGDDSYCLLAPIPGLSEVNPANTDLGDYLNIIIKFAIGFAGALAVIMMVLGGIQYMSPDALSGKSEGRERITYALGGLLLALASYLILNTINPNLVNLHLGIQGTNIQVVESPEDIFALQVQSFESTGQNTLGNKYLMFGNYAAPLPSAGVSDFVNTYLKNGYSLSEIKINTSTKKAEFVAKNGGATKSVIIDINIGANGASEVGMGVSGDLKTPKGIWTIPANGRKISENQDSAILNGAGVNMGAAFVNTGATLPSGTDRGIGFHGQANNNLGNTAGCIKMRNDDILILYPYMVSGVKVNIF